MDSQRALEMRKRIELNVFNSRKHEKTMLALNSERYGYTIDYVDFRFCPQCGAELYRFNQKLVRDRKIVDRDSGFISRCPICETFIPDGEAYKHSEHSWSGKSTQIYRFFVDMEEKRIPLEMENIDKQLAQMEQDYIPVVQEVAFTQIAEIKSNPEKLKEYIANLIKLEGNIYSIKQRLATLYYQRLLADRTIAFETKKPVYEKKKIATDALAKFQQLLASRTKELQELQKEKLPNPSSIKYPQEPQKPELLPVGFFDFVVGNKAKNESMMAEYEKQMGDYHKLVAECDREKSRLEEALEEHRSKIEQVQLRIKENRNNITTYEAQLKNVSIKPEQYAVPARGVKTILEQEIQQAEELFKQLLDARSSLYGFDVIFGKYRDLAVRQTKSVSFSVGFSEMTLLASS